MPSRRDPIDVASALRLAQPRRAAAVQLHPATDATLLAALQTLVAPATRPLRVEVSARVPVGRAIVLDDADRVLRVLPVRVARAPDRDGRGSRAG